LLMFSQLFGDPAPSPAPPPKAIMKQNKKIMGKSRRDIDREIRALDRQEAKLQVEIKALANKGQMNAAKLMAKELVRVRKQREQLMATKVKLGQVSARTEAVGATMAVQNAMTGATKAIKTANQITSPTKLQNTMAEYEKQSQIMALQDEMLDEVLDDPSQESEAEELVNKVYDEIGLELNSKLVNTPQKSQTVVPSKSKKEAENLDAVLEF